MVAEERKSPHFATAEECRACPYAEPCVQRPVAGGGLRMSPSTLFDCVLGGTAPDGSITGLLNDLERQARSAADARFGAGSRLSGGINNARGQWLENVLQLTFWNVAAAFSNNRATIVKLPNAAQLSFRNLYEPRAKGYLDELFDSLARQGMDMQMSNPDFICVTGVHTVGSVPNSVTTAPSSLVVNGTSMTALDDAYRNLIGQCRADSIPFVLTVKTSLRPDRRYQAVHEANVVKSLVAHLAGRFWQRELYTAFYAMVAGNVSPQDRLVLRNPVTHTLVQVNWTPVPVVDEVYQIDSIADVQRIIQQLLEKHLGVDNSATS